MLHEVTADGGLGFCQDTLPNVLPQGYHGPLVVALDSNVLIDLQHHGNMLLNGDIPRGIDERYARDLSATADLLNLWLLRDIRFVVTPRSLTDAKRLSKSFLDTRGPAVQAIADSLAFQLGDWTYPAPSRQPSRRVGNEVALPDGADRDLVLEAQGISAHVFLTRDAKVLGQTSLVGPPMAVASPAWLALEFYNAGVQPFGGGVCGTDQCPYAAGPLLAPDTGKWGGLLSIFGDNE